MRGPTGWVTKLTSRDPVVYLGVLVVAIVAVPVADQLLPGITLLGEVDVAQVIAVALGGVGLALWVRCRSAVRLGRLQQVFLGCVLAVWILTMALSIVRSPIPLPSALLTGLLVVLVWAKPPSTRSAGRALDVLAWSLVLAAILTVAAEASGLVDSWYAQLDLSDLLAFERSSYWLPLADVVGIDGRWAGPFIHPNRAGPVGGLLLVLALRRRGWDSWVFAITGLVMLALTASRTSQLAALAGVVLVLCLPWVLRAPRVAAPSRGIMAVALVGVVALLLAPVWLAPAVLGPGASDGNAYVSSAMTLTGRTTLWPVYVELWQASPWTGLGASGIFEAIYSGILPGWGSHAHNTYLDALTRNGVVAFVLVLAVVVVAALATLGDARRGRPIGLAIVGLLVVAGLGHTTIEWRYPEVPLVALILVVLMSAAAPGRSTVDESVASGEARQ